MQERPDPSYDDHRHHSPPSKPSKIDDLEANMPIASGNTLTQSVGVEGLSEAPHDPHSPLDTNLPLSAGADLRDKDSDVGVAGLAQH